MDFYTILGLAGSTLIKIGIGAMLIVLTCIVPLVQRNQCNVNCSNTCRMLQSSQNRYETTVVNNFRQNFLAFKFHTTGLGKTSYFFCDLSDEMQKKVN